jgi:uncharacterized OsmC-like protein
LVFSEYAIFPKEIENDNSWSQELMTRIEITYQRVGSCQVVHSQSGARIITDLPVEYGGAGASFSATDLLAAALGVCIATNIDKIADRHGIPLDALSVTVDKTLSQKPKRVAALLITVQSTVAIPSEIVQRLERAASHCGVHRSLHPDVQVTIIFKVLKL